VKHTITDAGANWVEACSILTARGYKTVIEYNRNKNPCQLTFNPVQYSNITDLPSSGKYPYNETYINYYLIFK